MTLATRARAWLPLLPVVGILAMTYWLDQQVKPIPATPDPRLQHSADAIVDNMRAVTLNQQGTPHIILTTKQLVHYADDDSTTLDTPDITAISPLRANIHMTAARGTLSSKGDVVELIDHAQITRAAYANQSELVVQSDYIKAIPDREFAQTDRPVTITDADHHVSAVGLEMNNRSQTLKLLSQVKVSNAVQQN